MEHHNITITWDLRAHKVPAQVPISVQTVRQVRDPSAIRQDIRDTEKVRRDRESLVTSYVGSLAAPILDSIGMLFTQIHTPDRANGLGLLTNSISLLVLARVISGKCLDNRDQPPFEPEVCAVRLPDECVQELQMPGREPTMRRDPSDDVKQSQRYRKADLVQIEVTRVRLLGLF